MDRAIFTRLSITGTSTSTPTTVARVAPEERPNRLMATATASSKKLDAPIIPDGGGHLVGNLPEFGPAESQKKR